MSADRDQAVGLNAKKQLSTEYEFESESGQAE